MSGNLIRCCYFLSVIFVVFNSFPSTVSQDETETITVANISNEEDDILQDFVSVNNTERFIILKQQRFIFKILPEGNELQALWDISVQGDPNAQLQVLCNGTPISDLPEKYTDVELDDLNVFFHIKNVSEEDLWTNFQLFAGNDYENQTLNLTFDATDIKLNAITVFSLGETEATLKCTAASLVPTNISWFFKSCFTAKCSYKTVVEYGSEVDGLFYTSYLKVNSSMKGFLMCNSTNNKNRSSFVYQEIEDLGEDFDIFGPASMEEVDKVTKVLHVDRSQAVTLTCGSSAYNHSKDLKWIYGDINSGEITDFRHVSPTRTTVFTHQKFLSLSGFNLFGTFLCKAKTKNGGDVYKRIQISDKVFNSTYYIIGGFVFLVALIFVYIVLRKRNNQKEIQKLDSVGLANFEKGGLEHFNPNLSIDDQADLLPYDRKYEFPMEKLKLGEQIGSGAFGVVVKGEAKNIFENGSTTTVAIKMVNKSIGDVYIKALASELKIMIYLGKHVNIVNLLGACTKNIIKRELLVIVEYCRFGNLRDYLQNHRSTFVDQINAETGQIDFSIGSDKLGSSDPPFPFSNRAQAEISTSPPPEAESEEALNVNYKRDYQEITKPVCTRDLLLWSFQVARGMEYLSSRKVLHGDLAARNILLTDGNVVKISDFGLSKKMYQTDIYKKTGDEMLPVKWMAIEAITDKIFSVQSDIWSYGILLWEFFSLARTPYPGMEYNETFCENLLNGYRMKSPQFATEEIYEIMVQCWDVDPSCRPPFSQLVNRVGSVLDQQIREHYVDMNIGYLKMNNQRFNGNDSDYLSMAGTHDFQQSSPSRYVNVGEEFDTYL